MQKKDYKSLYNIQNKVLKLLYGLKLPFYLTGGTALGRFYLNHRYSDDLDFFVNDNKNFKKHTDKIFTAFNKNFTLSPDKISRGDDFFRIFIEELLILKIDFINDVPYRTGKSISYKFGNIDNLRNILANKITAIEGREEPKDIFDIIYISNNYNFDWLKIFREAKKKAVLDEIHISRKIYDFPVKYFENINWSKRTINFPKISAELKKISKDILMGSRNSLGVLKPDISKALPSG